MAPTRSTRHVRRRLLPATPTPSPPKDRSEVERSVVADRLVDSSVAIISSIWHAPLPLSGNATPPSHDAGSSLDAAGEKGCTAAPQLPLHLFIRETLRRSRTSCSTLQAALLYCIRAQRGVTIARLEAAGRYDDAARLAQQHEDDIHRGAAGLASLLGNHCESSDSSNKMNTDASEAGQQHDLHAFDRERGYFLALTPQPTAFEATIAGDLTSDDDTEQCASPSSPLLQRADDAPVEFHHYLDSQSTPFSSKAPPQPTSATSAHLLCGRRMFLASVMVASKFLQDRTYLNRAWAKLSGLSAPELLALEGCLLHAIGYNLNVQGGPPAWADWIVELEIRAVADRARSQAQHQQQQLVAQNQTVLNKQEEANVAAAVADEVLDLSELSDLSEDEGAAAAAAALGGEGKGRTNTWAAAAQTHTTLAAVQPPPAPSQDAIAPMPGPSTSTSASESASAAAILATAHALAYAVHRHSAVGKHHFAHHTLGSSPASPLRAAVHDVVPVGAAGGAGVGISPLLGAKRAEADRLRMVARASSCMVSASLASPSSSSSSSSSASFSPVALMSPASVRYSPHGSVSALH